MAENKKFRVYLVNAGSDGGMASIANDSCFPALGVLQLGTWLKHKLPDVEIICRDGQVMPTEAIAVEIAELKPDLVGVSVLCTSYQNSLDIAAAAKKAGSKVVFGNDQASQLSQEILKNRPDVDYVIGAEYGEEPLERLVRALCGKTDVSDISTLTYRDKNGHVQGFDYHRDKRILAITNAFPLALGIAKPSRKTALDIYPLIDWSLYPQLHWETYTKNYRARFQSLMDEEVTGVVTMNRARGCSRANENIKCKHCDMLLDVALSSPEAFWVEVKNAHEKTGANIFYEVCDSFSSFPSFVHAVADAKPKDLGFEPHFKVYCQAVDLVRNPQLVDELERIGVYKVNIGLESGCDTTLKHMKGQNDSVETNYKALQLLKAKGIHVYGSFVLGTDPETPATLRETVDWVKKIIKERLIDDVEAQPILPLPHNYYGKKMIAEAGEAGNPFRADKHSDWPFNTDDLSRSYINKHSGVTHYQAVSAVGEIRQAARTAHLNYGSGTSRKDNWADLDDRSGPPAWPDQFVHPGLLPLSTA
jgi:radical SAM superfamily enzyme YgiQ (UPF0313 family)